MSAEHLIWLGFIQRIIMESVYSKDNQFKACSHFSADFRYFGLKTQKTIFGPDSSDPVWNFSEVLRFKMVFIVGTKWKTMFQVIKCECFCHDCWIKHSLCPQNDTCCHLLPDLSSNPGLKEDQNPVRPEEDQRTIRIQDQVSSKVKKQQIL